MNIDDNAPADKVPADDDNGAPPAKRRSPSAVRSYAQATRPDAQNTNAIPPAIFLSVMAADSVHITAHPYRNGKTEDFEHFCGTGCKRGMNCHNVGPPGASKSLAMYGVCDFCLNSARADISVNRKCNALLHVVRVGTLEKYEWHGVLDPSAPLPSSGKTTIEAIQAIDRRFRAGKDRQEREVELRGLRESNTTLGSGIRDINATQRQAEKSGQAEPGSAQSACHDLMKFYDFKDSLGRKASDLQNAKRYKR